MMNLDENEFIKFEVMVYMDYIVIFVVDIF